MSFFKSFRELKEKCSKMKKDQFLIVLLTGILLLVITLPTDRGKNEEKEKETKEGTPTELNTEIEHTSAEFLYIKSLEEKLEQGLSYIDGVGKVKVMITLKAGTEQVVLKDLSDSGMNTIEKDAGGGNRTITENETTEVTIYTENSDGSMIPYVAQTLSPIVEGVTVVCEGGDDAMVRANITEVVKALFPVEVHKIKVVRMAVTKSNSGKETIER